MSAWPFGGDVIWPITTDANGHLLSV